MLEMKNYLKILIFSAALLASPKIFAQSAVDMRINEIEPVNLTGYTDEDGNRSGWVELYNSSFGMVDIAGFYMSDDPAQPKKFRIPKGNVATKVPLRQFFVLFADGHPEKGPFHMSFTLGSTGQLYIYGPDGALVDEMHWKDVPADESFGRKIDGEGMHEKPILLQRSIRKSAVDNKIGADGGFAIIDHPTPKQTNVTVEIKTKSQRMKEIDPDGFILSLTAMSVVFLGLIVLYICFKYIGKNSVKKAKEKAAAVSGKSVDDISKEESSAEVYAAITAAFHLYLADSEVHDNESNIITIQNESRSYSPWSQKIYTLRETPQLRGK